MKYLIFLILLSCQGPVLKTVVSVHDGDTFTLASGKKIRLAYIDCPEIGQPYAQEARNALIELISGRPVKVNYCTTDKYGRDVALVYNYNGILINEALVERGYAWVYRKYAPDYLFMEEQSSKAAKIGLWEDPKPQPPFIYRLNH